MALKYLGSKRVSGKADDRRLSQIIGTSSADLGASSAKYRGGLKVVTGSTLIGKTLGNGNAIEFELKRTGLAGSGHSVSRFEIWKNDSTRVYSETFRPDTKVGEEYAWVPFAPVSGGKAGKQPFSNTCGCT